MYVRVVGENSFVWVEAVGLWGATVEPVVLEDKLLPKELRQTFNDPPVIPRDAALKLPPVGGAWSGIMFATIQDKSDAALIGTFLTAWQPATVVLAFPDGLTWRERFAYVRENGAVRSPRGGGKYTMFWVKVSHEELGGGDGFNLAYLLYVQSTPGHKPWQANDSLGLQAPIADDLG